MATSAEKTHQQMELEWKDNVSDNLDGMLFNEVPVNDGERDGRSHQGPRDVVLWFNDPEVGLGGGHEEVQGAHEDHAVHRLSKPRLHDAETETHDDDQHPGERPLGAGYDLGGEDQAGSEVSRRVDVAELRLRRNFSFTEREAKLPHTIRQNYQEHRLLQHAEKDNSADPELNPK